MYVPFLKELLGIFRLFVFQLTNLFNLIGEYIDTFIS